MNKPIKQLALAGMLLAMLGTAQGETLRFGMDGNYPPFTKQGADGNLQGFDVDIAQALCQVMQVTCQIVPQDWDGLIPGLNANKYDAILSSMSITAERKKAVDFTNKYYHVPARMIAKAGSSIGAKDFSGKRIGVLRASTQEKYARDVWGKNGANIVVYGKAPEAFLDLKSGRVDGVFVTSEVGDQDFIQTKQGAGYAFVGAPITDVRYFGEGAGIAVKKGNAELVQRLNQAISQIRKNGSYGKIQKKYFSADIFGD
ncbi:ABC transporter substrate-binding protein [Vogesella sp. GCM10023246]|uniref:ABC transporter substrate-binding protein n=1 Tax=Vogesella oryzagri TaxID=3160864 RepID=A0ABV1LYZ9_9NEIS